MSESTPFNPSGLLDPRGSADFRQLLWDNFFILNSSPAFQRQPTFVNGQPTTIVGPPLLGQHYANVLWVDAIRSLWLCTVSGTPGTWVQLEVPVVAAFPTTTRVGYRAILSTDGFSQHYWDGADWVEISGGAGGTTVTAGENISISVEGEVAVIHDPNFVGSTQVDYVVLGNQASAPTATANSVVTWVDATGTTPNRVITWKARQADGTDMILSSCIV